MPNKNFFTLDRFRSKPRSSTSPLVVEHPWRVAGNLEVTSSLVGLVPTNALVLSGLANFQLGRDVPYLLPGSNYLLLENEQTATLLIDLSTIVAF